jgi:asparagine synthase (glutamine-hydrolysing)
MKGFRGRFTAEGAFAAAPVGAAESFLGCEVLMRGYLADRTDLRGRFGLDAPSLAGDAELLAHAFRLWGENVQAHVNGQYALAIWDVQAKRGFLTHDAFGLEPLFYARRSGGLTFSTDLVDLVDPEATASLDEEYIADFLACGAITGERTPYRSVRRLLPGRSLRWAGGELRELRTWDLTGVSPLTYRDDAEYEERFRTLLVAAVCGAMDTPGRVGISLSGGLDSSSIACVAAQTGRHDLGAYSFICPGWPDADERRWMRAVVDHTELPWRTFDIEAALPFSMLPADFVGEPAPSVIDEERRRVFGELLAADGVTALLTGDAGDYVLGAAPGTVPDHLADALFDGRVLSAISEVVRWKRDAWQNRSYSYWFLRALAEPALAHLRARRVRTEKIPLPRWFDDDYATSMRLERRALRRPASATRHPGRQAVLDNLWIGALGATNFPRQRMLYEVRRPLLYRPLVEFMWSIPWEQKLRPRCDRYLQRRALAGVLPELVRRRASKTRGTAPFVEGLRRSSDWIPYLSDTPLMAERGIVDAGRWRQAVREASVGQTNSDKYFLAGVAVEAWLKQLNEHRTRAVNESFAAVPA